MRPNPLPNHDKITSKRFIEAVAGMAASRQSTGLVGSYLLTGPRSVSKLSTARYIAKLAVCTGTRDASCACRSCTTGLASCADVHLALVNEKGNLLASSLSGIDYFFSSHPTTGASRKVLIVEDIDKATNGTDMMLLKLLEGGIKPPDLALFTTSYPTRVNRALASRMSVVRFRGDTEEEALEALGESASARDLAKSRTRLSLGVTTPEGKQYLSARKSLPLALAGIMASDPTRAWRAINGAVASPDSSLQMAEVLHEAMADMLALVGGFPQNAAILGAQKREMASHAVSWGQPSLASLADDLRVMIAVRLPGQDLRTHLYRWVLKASDMASRREFSKPDLVATDTRVQETHESDDVLIDFGD